MRLSGRSSLGRRWLRQCPDPPPMLKRREALRPLPHWRSQWHPKELFAIVSSLFG